LAVETLAETAHNYEVVMPSLNMYVLIGEFPSSKESAKPEKIDYRQRREL
jgi:hypothetical protein